MRCLFNTAAKDVRRFRLYEKSLDAFATSPYARTVDRWLLAGTCLLGADFAQLHHSAARNPTTPKPSGRVILLGNCMFGSSLNVGRGYRLGEWSEGSCSGGWAMSRARCWLLPALLPSTGRPACCVCICMPARIQRTPHWPCRIWGTFISRSSAAISVV